MGKLPDYIYKSNIWSKEPHVIIEGRYSLGSDIRIDNVLLENRDINTEYFYISGIDLDMELSQSFEYLYSLDDLNNYLKVDCKIINVSQQYGKRFNFLPKGWTLICAIKFIDKIPDIIKTCPIVSQWGGLNNTKIVLSNYTFLSGLRG